MVLGVPHVLGLFARLRQASARTWALKGHQR